MNTSAPQMSDMDIHLPSHTRWSYYTSDARSEKVPAYRASPYHPTQQTPLPAHRSPPFTPAAPAVQTSLGIWEDDDDVYYSSEWPPVQEYLDLVRSTRRKVKASSEMVFALAALHVVHTPADVAHWILWRQDTYYHTADRVTAIARTSASFPLTSSSLFMSPPSPSTTTHQEQDTLDRLSRVQDDC